MTRTTWIAKDPAESLVATFDFALALDPLETIGSASVTSTLIAGVDPTPAAVISGSPVIAGGAVKCPFSGGVDGASYTLRCQITTSASRILVLAATLPVRTA